jgi:putative copper export protein
MFDGEQKMNPYDPPIQSEERGVRSSLAVIVLFVACIAMALFSVAVSGHAILKILETTPAMGIMVDARGNRIPIQGYPQLGFGLAGVLLFTVLAVVFGLLLAEKRNASYRRNRVRTAIADRPPHTT